VAKTDDVFTVFISHKHDDHALAVEVKIALEGLVRPKLIDCFVSGIDITAGMDWRREIQRPRQEPPPRAALHHPVE
jgi:metal-dependent hydrolase (beta-lactamase superfamily II)